MVFLYPYGVNMVIFSVTAEVRVKKELFSHWAAQAGSKLLEVACMLLPESSQYTAIGEG